MKSYFPFILVFSISILLAILYARTPLRTNFESAPSSMENFMALDCAVNSPETELIKAMRTQSEKAEVYFTDIIENGAPREAIATAQRGFAGLYSTYLEFITEDSRRITIERSKEDAKLWQPASMSKEAFVKRKTIAFERRIIYRALEGLAVLRTRSAREYLRKKATDESFELADYAQELAEG